MTSLAGAIEFARSDNRQPDVRTLGAPDRAVTIQDGGLCAASQCWQVANGNGSYRPPPRGALAATGLAGRLNANSPARPSRPSRPQGKDLSS